jgi:hypothetical protein
MKFRKKPVVIEAVQFIYTDKGMAELKEFMGDAMGFYKKDRHPSALAELQVKTLEDGEYGGNGFEWKVAHIATEGDWIIKGVQGEFYACKPEIFAETYEATE